MDLREVNRKMANTKKMDYVLLGLLSHEPMTGYEMKKRLDTSLRFFWGGSIYPTLNSLKKKEKLQRKIPARMAGRKFPILLRMPEGKI